MRKPIYLIAILITLSKVSVGQLYDNTWIMGSPCVKTSFYNPLLIDTFDTYINTQGTWASMCNYQGDLLFFTNGVNVWNWNGDLMNGGTGISDDEISAAWNYGLLFYHGALCFPKEDNQYYLINHSISDEQVNTGNVYSADQLFYSVIDMDGNGGLGQVISKRNILYNQAMVDNHLTGCRHANGRDWWLIANAYWSNKYLKWLVTPDSIINAGEQMIGDTFKSPDLFGQIIFSPDGSKLAGATVNSDLVILDFDRCTGELSNPINVPVPYDTIFPEMNIAGNGAYALAFSPNSRFMYLFNKYFIYQYDLNQEDLGGTRKLIYRWKPEDGYTYTNEAYLAPNGKIVISNYHGVGTQSYHLINFPDELDTACNFELNGFPMPSYGNIFLNNTFNYRLGPLVGSACDTIINDVETVISENSYIKITPNPATDKLQLSLYKYLPNAQLMIADELGRVVYENHHYYLDEYLDISQWQKGVYFVKIYNSEKTFTGRFVKE